VAVAGRAAKMAAAGAEEERWQRERKRQWEQTSETAMLLLLLLPWPQRETSLLPRESDRERLLLL
jgi:hypothetical protein